MTTLETARPLATGVGARSGLLADLDGQPALGFVGPNWFAPVMGTGIVAVAAATLPVDVPGLAAFARAVWVLDVVLLGAVVAATAAHWWRHPDVARTHLDHPTMSHSYGAPAMALMTVGAGGLLVGQPVVGTAVAVGLDAVLWTVGTLLGLAAATVVPYRTFVVRGDPPDAAFGGWLMPVVPPMVSAATGPLLLTHLPAGRWQLAMQLACSILFALALVSSLVVIAMICRRLVRHGVGPAAAVPTLWIVLGPLGQSITAVHTLGTTAPGVLPAPYDAAVRAAGPLYGAPVLGLATLWLALVVAITVRTARRGLPFSLAWWSFTFPVGTVVTGASALASSTGVPGLVAVAVVLYVGLVAAWIVVAVRTGRGVYGGRLLRN